MEHPTTCEIATSIAEASKKEAGKYAQVFRQKKNSKDDGWALLEKIFELVERFDDLSQPYHAMIVLEDGRRSFLPEDLSSAELDWLRDLETNIRDPEFCARLSDILWLRTREKDFAERAVAYYLDSARNLEDLIHWTESAKRYTRSYRLATQLGRKSVHRNKVLHFVLDRLRSVGGNDPRWWSLKLMQLVYEARIGHHSEMIDFSLAASRGAAELEEFRRQREYLNFIAKLHHRDQDLQAAEEILVLAAQSHRKEAEAAQVSGGGMKAHHHWESAVRAYQERPSLRQEIPELKARLAASGQEMIDLMETHSQSTDISDIVEQVQLEFRDQSSDVALYKFVCFDLSSFASVKAEVEKFHDQFLSSMFDKRVVDYEGRTVAIVPGVSSEEDQKFGERLKFEIQQRMARRREFSIQALIRSAFRILADEHIIDDKYLSSLLRDSTFIPRGREGQFCYGLSLGFDFQFGSAAHILVPQFEAGLRQVANVTGVTPRNLSASGVEDAWGLERLLREPSVVSFLGDDLTFELKSLLIEDYGPKFRHNLCHGLIPPEYLEGADAVYAWWLFLRLCVMTTAGFRAFSMSKSVTESE